MDIWIHGLSVGYCGLGWRLVLVYGYSLDTHYGIFGVAIINSSTLPGRWIFSSSSACLPL